MDNPTCGVIHPQESSMCLVLTKKFFLVSTIPKGVEWISKRRILWLL
jgi:hypothetical protein